MIFTKTLFFSVTFFSNRATENKYLYHLPKNLILLKEISLCKKIHSGKQTHYVKDQFNFQFSFATNEQI